MNLPLLLTFLQRSVFYPAVLSSLLCWLAFPPVGWGILAWFAPIGWLLPIVRQDLPDGRPYRSLWLAGCVFWMLTVHWIRLPHPANYLAWLLLSSYLGCYLPTFVALSRVGVHRFRLPLWLVAPIIWTGLDWVRAHLMTGFLMGSLAHTQVENPLVIQIADLVGEYGVTFIIVLVAASLTSVALSLQAGLPRLHPLVPALISIVATLSYGHMQSQDLASPQAIDNKNQPGDVRVALIQGNTRADWKHDRDRRDSIMQEYVQLTVQALDQSLQRDGRKVDLIIWPETSYLYPMYTLAKGYQPLKNQYPESYLKASQVELAEFVRQTKAAILTGITRVHLFLNEAEEHDEDYYNSSIFIDKQGVLVGNYDKMHLVVMGEYVPFTDWFPFLDQLTPMTGLAVPGQTPQAFSADSMIYCPNICYETVVPHLIRRHVTELADSGAVPDVLVNLTNDAWYWGSSELDMHLACGIFRAVEHHIPLVIAGNGGLSAHVDAFGNLLQVTPRQETAILLVDLEKRGSARLTLYARWGDWFAGLCVLCCMVLAVARWRKRRAANLASQSDVAST